MGTHNWDPLYDRRITIWLFYERFFKLMHIVSAHTGRATVVLLKNVEAS